MKTPGRSHSRRLARLEGRDRLGGLLSYATTIRSGVFLGSRIVELSEMFTGFNVIFRI